MLWVLLLLAICLPLAVAKFQDDSPLLMLVSGDALGGNLARMENVSTGTYFLGIKPQYLEVPFTVLMYASNYILASIFLSGRLRWVWLYGVTAVVVSLDAFSSLSKGFVLIPIMSLWFTYALTRTEGRLVTGRAFAALAPAVVLVAIFAQWVLGQAEVSIWFPVERLVLGNLIPQYFVVASFTAENALLGASAPRWMTMGTHDQFLLDVFTWRGLMGGTGSVFYTAPSSFVAEGHANFVAFGVVIWSLIAFNGLALIDRLLGLIRGRLVFCALTVFLAIHYSRLARSGLVSFLVDYHVWAVLVFALLVTRVVIVRSSAARMVVASAGRRELGSKGV